MLDAQLPNLFHRFEVQIEVSLPDEEGRGEIFEIHTRSMQAAGMLGGDVDLRQLAAATGRFSGAEIAGVVRSASAFALERYVCFVVCVVVCMTKRVWPIWSKRVQVSFLSLHSVMLRRLIMCNSSC